MGLHNLQPSSDEIIMASNLVPRSLLMRLSRTGRWMLSNQYRILELLDEENADQHRHAREALERGYELFYSWICEHVCDDRHVLPEVECTYVLDVMTMFDALQLAYDSLDDRSGIDGNRVLFYGFDGNNEASYMSFARFYCEQQEAFQHLRKGGDGFNSHWPTKQLYRPMVAAWKASDDKYKLTKADVIRITEAVVLADDVQGPWPKPGTRPEDGPGQEPGHNGHDPGHNGSGHGT
jgi:uncharacterized protein